LSLAVLHDCPPNRPVHGRRSCVRFPLHVPFSGVSTRPTGAFERTRFAQAALLRNAPRRRQTCGTARRPCLVGLGLLIALDFTWVHQQQSRTRPEGNEPSILPMPCAVQGVVALPVSPCCVLRRCKMPDTSFTAVSHQAAFVRAHPPYLRGKHPVFGLQCVTSVGQPVESPVSHGETSQGLAFHTPSCATWRREVMEQTRFGRGEVVAVVPEQIMCQGAPMSTGVDHVCSAY
jgi:hypothetical protein